MLIFVWRTIRTLLLIFWIGRLPFSWAQGVDNLASEFPGQPAPPSTSPFEDAGPGAAAQGLLNLASGDASLTLNLFALSGPAAVGEGFAVSYSSDDIESRLGTWNVEAPTGVLGLGWSFGYGRIVADKKLTATDTDDEYVLQDGGQFELVFDLEDSDDIGDYRSYKTDPLVAWQVRYYPGLEQWQVRRDDGTIYVYGGAADDAQHRAIEWGVKWSNFLGPSSQLSGQSRYAVVWNRAAVEAPTGSRVTYTYRRSSERVGTAIGPEHTLASYIERVQVEGGDYAEFTYQTKRYEGVLSGDCREYQDPHIEGPEPDAYQERYESDYLDGVNLYTQSGILVKSISFNYDFVGAGSLCKRLLSSIHAEGEGGLEQPPHEFEYRSASPNEGALSVMRRPEGGSVTFTYDTVELNRSQQDANAWVYGWSDACEANPQGVGCLNPDQSGYYDPRVFHGPDYVVVTWVRGQEVKVVVHTWDGEWVTTQFDVAINFSQVNSYQNGLYFTDAGRRMQDFSVYTESDFFGLVTYGTIGPIPESKEVHLFHKSEGYRAGWTHFSYGPDWSDTVRLPVVTGKRFLAALTEGNGWLKVFTWTGDGWRVEDKCAFASCNTQGGEADFNFQATGMNNYVFVYDNRDNDAAAILYLDQSNTWRTSPSFTTPHNFQCYDDPYQGCVPAVAAQSSPTAVLYSYLGQSNGYGSTSALQWWGEDFAMLSDKVIPGLTYLAGSYRMDSFYSMDSNQFDVMGAVNGWHKMYAYDGLSWTESGGIYGQLARARHAPGIFAARSNSQGVLQVTYHEPNSGGWVSSTIDAPEPSAEPHPGSKYLAYGSNLYYRGPGGWTFGGTSTWLPAVGTLPHSSSDMWRPSVKTVSPHFMTYEPGGDTEPAEQVGEEPGTYVQLFKNGALLGTPVWIDGWGSYHETYGLRSTSSLVGSGTLALYPRNVEGTVNIYPNNVDDFFDVRRFRLHRYVKDAVQGAQTDHPVRTVTFDAADGTAPVSTSIKYDATTAIMSSDGRSARYNAVTIVPNSSDPNVQPEGRTVRYFFNGLPSEQAAAPFPSGSAAETNAASAYRYLLGRVYREVSYDALGAELMATDRFYLVIERPVGERDVVHSGMLMKEEETQHN